MFEFTVHHMPYTLDFFCSFSSYKNNFIPPIKLILQSAVSLIKRYLTVNKPPKKPPKKLKKQKNPTTTKTQIKEKLKKKNLKKPKNPHEARRESCA